MNKTRRVLIVDDEASTLLMLQLLMEKAKYEVVGTAENGKQAVELAKSLQPDLILMDVSMPGINGLEATRQIMANSPTPILIMTAHKEVRLSADCALAGACGHLVKPAHSDDVCRAADVAIARFHDLQEMRRLNATLQAEISAHEKATEALATNQTRLTALTRHLINVREEERTKISREIHDELGQMLSGLQMDVSLIQKNLASQNNNSSGLQPTLSKLDGMRELIEHGVSEIRRISALLRPGMLDDLGMSSAMKWQVRQFEERTGIHCELTIQECPDMPDNTRTALFRIFQEALTNIMRHSKATQVKIKLDIDDKQHILTINDNGRGITEQEIHNGNSFGLLGMRERAQMEDGVISIKGKPGRGTFVQVAVPIKKEVSNEG